MKLLVTEPEIRAAITALLTHPFEVDEEAGGRYDPQEVRAAAVAVLQAAALVRKRKP